MFQLLSRRTRIAHSEAGLTLVELLVASALSVVVMGAVVTLVIGAVRDQPKISKQSQNITTARGVLERMTREIRSGIAVTSSGASKLSFEGYVRHSTCGGSTLLASSAAPIVCSITYECSVTSCSRLESPKGSTSGTPQLIFSGINSSQVFTYAPNATAPTYVKVTLRLPNPSGTGALTISDGASLRNATLGY
jgi:type II secretory pathway pseudopilin PulG